MPPSGTEPVAASTKAVAHATAIVEAYLSNNPLPRDEVPALIRSIHAALTGALGNTASATAHGPAVPIKKSVTPDYIVCLEDGKKFKMLKRYLRARYGLSPEQYRAKWGLPVDYPMVCPNYAAFRAAFAKNIGLGKRDTPAKKRKRG